jgi:uncharacterized protein (TIGR02001 family)
MRNALRACAAAVLAAVPFLAQAQAAPAAAAKPEPEFTLTGNAGLFSDYRFRGFTQTGYKPAFQGGFDFAHKSGFYLGNWNSNVESGLYNGASLEMDFYGGYKTTFGDFGFDIGYLYYFYPNSGADNSIPGATGPTTKISNGEIYVGGTWGPLSAKWFYSTTKFFALGKPPTSGDADTKGSWYLDLTGSLPIGETGFTAVAHYGYQYIKNADKLFKQKIVFEDSDNIGDWKVGVTYDLSGWLLGASVVGTTRTDFFKTAESTFTDGSGKTRVVLNVSKTF